MDVKKLASAYFLVTFFVQYVEYIHLVIPVWDMGHAIQYIHAIPETNPLYTFFYQGVLYLFAPLYFFDNVVSLIFAQSLVMTAVIPVLHRIALEVTNDVKKADFVALLYVFYPQNWGIFFFPFHFQTLFLPFFFLMYYYVMKDKPLHAGVFSALASLVRYPYVYLVVFYALTERRYRNRAWRAVLLTSVAIAVVSTVLSLHNPQAVPPVDKEAHLDAYSSIPLIDRVMTYLTVLYPASFMVVSPYAVNLIPSFVYFALVNYQSVLYPNYFRFQYAPLFEYAVLLSVIDALRRFELRRFMYVNAMLSFVLFSVVSPLSINTVDWYAVFTTPTYVFYLDKLLPYLPQNATYMVQNNLPELFPNADGYVAPLTLGMMNITMDNYSVSHNNYRIWIFTEWVNESVDYVVVDPLGEFFNVALNQTNFFYTHGYGIYAEYGYIFVLKYNYSGKPVVFKPFEFVLTRDVGVYLAPGVYNVSAPIYLNGTLVNDTFTLDRFGYYVVNLTVTPTYMMYIGT